jgi:hypothetical protein
MCIIIFFKELGKMSTKLSGQSWHVFALIENT